MTALADLLTEAATTSPGPARIMWGQITTAGPPMRVRLAGDTDDTTVPLRIAGTVFADGDKILLVRIGGALAAVGTLTTV